MLVRLFQFLDSYLMKKAMSHLGIKVSNIREEFYSSDEITLLNISQCLNRIRLFYYNEAEDYCINNNLDFLEQLLLRRRELKQKIPFLSNFFINFGVGVISGITANNVASLKSLVSTYHVGFFDVLQKSFAIFIILVVAYFISSLLAAVFQYVGQQMNPKIQYLLEKEAEIIEEILNSRTNM